MSSSPRRVRNSARRSVSFKAGTSVEPEATATLTEEVPSRPWTGYRSSADSAMLDSREPLWLDDYAWPGARPEDGTTMRPDPMTAGTAGPDGQEMTVRKRIAEILGRYGPDHVVSRALAR